MASHTRSTTPTPTPTLARLAELRTLAESDQEQAAHAAWEWIAALGKADQMGALGELFGAGVAQSPRMRTEGMPVGKMRNLPKAGILNAILAVDSPWTGKTFHADGSGGYNRVKLYALPTVLALNPKHLRREGREITSFPFATTIEAGKVEPKVDVLSIQYDKPEFDNPSGVVPLTKIVDELVLILPEVYLGRATAPRKDGSYTLVGYFALRTPVR